MKLKLNFSSTRNVGILPTYNQKKHLFDCTLDGVDGVGDDDDFPPEMNDEVSKSKIEFSDEDLHEEKAKTIQFMMANGINHEILAKPIIPNNVDGEIGNVNACKNTVDRYHDSMITFRNFLLKMQFYDSAMAVFYGIIPKFSWSVSYYAVWLFLNYMVCEEGTSLKNEQNQQLCWPGTNIKIKCSGLWTSKSSIDIFGAALKMYWDTTFKFNPEITYEDMCPLCQSNTACPHHAPNPALFPRGNLCQTEKFKKNQSRMIAYAKEKYDSKKTHPFYPSQLRKIRNYLLSGNFIDQFMLWVIILVGCMQCLRCDEVLTLLFVFGEDTVDSLFYDIFGKTDKWPVNFSMFDRKDCADLSPTRMLLLWIKICGIKKGYIFPTLEQLRNRHNLNGHFTEHYKLRSLLNDIKFLCYIVLKIQICTTVLQSKSILRTLRQISIPERFILIMLTRPSVLSTILFYSGLTIFF